MSAIVEAVLTDSSFENRELSYAALQRAKAARYCALYDRLQIENPKWRSADLCGTLGISAQRLNKYRHLLGAPKRVTKMTTEQKQAAQAKGMLTRSKNDAYRRYLAELKEKNLEFSEMKRLLEEWERGHGMPDMAPSHSSLVGEGASRLSDPRERVEASSPHSGNYPPFVAAGRSSAHKKRGGSLAAESAARHIPTLAEESPDAFVQRMANEQLQRS